MDLTSVSLGLLTLAILAIVLGAVFKGITGVGLPVLSVPLMASFTSVENAVVLMVLPGLSANALIVLTHRKWHLLTAHKGFLAIGFAGALLGTWLLSAMDDRWLKLILAIWLGIYLVQYFSRRGRIHVTRIPRWLVGILGVSAGTIQGATGISAPIVGPYFHAAGLTRGPYAFTAAFTFLLFSIAQFTAMAGADLLTPDRLVIGLIAILPTLFFTQLGIRISGSVSDLVFNRILVTLFVLMELKLIMDIL
jgi:uncharacterized membrane protein YfcA